MWRGGGVVFFMNFPSFLKSFPTYYISMKFYMLRETFSYSITTFSRKVRCCCLTNSFWSMITNSTILAICWNPKIFHETAIATCGRLRLKCDGTRAETRCRLSAKGTSPFKSAGGRQYSRILEAEVCASAVVMLDTLCSEVV